MAMTTTTAFDIKVTQPTAHTESNQTKTAQTRTERVNQVKQTRPKNITKPTFEMSLKIFILKPSTFHVGDYFFDTLHEYTGYEKICVTSFVSPLLHLNRIDV